MNFFENLNRKRKYEKEKQIFGKQKKKNLILSSIFFSVVAIITIVGSLGLTNNEAENVFSAGTYINGQSVSGYTVEMASQVVSDNIKQKIDGITIDIMYKDKIWKFNQDDFEIDGAVKSVVQKAYDNYKVSKTSTKNMSNSKILNSLSNNYTSTYNVSLKNTFKNFD